MKSPSKTGNKFAAILQSRTSPAVDEQEPAPVTVEMPPLVISPRPVIEATPHQRATIQPAATATVEEPRRVGRIPGKGKSSDPSYRQVTAYIPQELHNNATIALRLANQVKIDAEKEDFSELLTRLLAGWYEKQTFYRPSE